MTAKKQTRAYWTPERKRAAVPAHRFRSGANVSDAFDAVMPDAANAAPTTDPRQADLGKMPFVTGGKLFFTLDGVDYTSIGNIFMRNNLLLTAAHCVQDDVTGLRRLILLRTDTNDSHGIGVDATA